MRCEPFAKKFETAGKFPPKAPNNAMGQTFIMRRQILVKTNTWLDASQVGRTDRFQVVTMRAWASTLCTLFWAAGAERRNLEIRGARNEFGWRLALCFTDRLS
jgi:hypothetical protein